MSISNVRNFIEKSGCGLVTAVVIGVVMVASVFSMNCARGQGGEETTQPDEVVAKIGSSTLSFLSLNEQINTQMADVPPSTPLDQRATFYAMLIRQGTDQMIVEHLAKTKGITISDEDLKASITKQIDQQVEGLRSQLVQQKQLDAGASQADFEKLFEKQSGQTLASLKEKALTDTLSNPARSAGQKSRLYQEKLTQKMAADAKVSDDDVKAFMRNYTVEKIVVAKAKGTTSPEELIQKASSDLKAGKSFDEVQALYSEEKEKGPMPMMGMEMFFTPDMAPLRTLKVGQVSEPIKTQFGWTITKMVKVDDTPLKNFEKDKVEQRKSVTDFVGRGELTRLQEAERKNIKYMSVGVEHLMKAYDMVAGPEAGTATKETLLELARQDPTDPSPLGQQAATFGRYLAFFAAQKEFTATEKTENRPLNIELLQACSRVADGVDLRIKLAELLTEEKQPAAVEELVNAISQNTGSFDEAGQQIFSSFGPLLEKMKKAGIVTPEGETKVNEAMDTYRTSAKEHAAFVAQQEEERKKAEAEQKKAEAAAKKEAEEAKKKAGASGTKPATPSTSELLNPGAKPPTPAGP